MMTANSSNQRVGPAALLRLLVAFAAVLCSFTGTAGPGDRCGVCNAPLLGSCYILEDKMTHEKKEVCQQCTLKLPNCFLCGLPALTNAPGAATLTDGRALCARDARNAVLDETEGVQVGQKVKDDLARQLARFLSLPERNVSFATLDRIHLMEIFKLPGNDLDCPNVWGRTVTETNNGAFEHRISVLSGLPRGWFRSTCAHECAHTWLIENLSAARKATLSNYAEEGFCELLAFLDADAVGDQDAKATILANSYTRGQVRIFVDTEKQYGLNDIVDWMKYGTDGELRADDLGRVKSVKMPARSLAAPAPLAGPTVALVAAKTPDRLVLKGIFWDPKRPTAIVNDYTFRPGQQGEIRVGHSNVLVRCVEIRPQSVRLQVGSERDEQELKLKPRPATER